MRLKFYLLFFIGLFLLFPANTLAQTEYVTAYNFTDFQGFPFIIKDNWSGGILWDRKIKSIRVPKGYRVKIYSEKNFKGTQANLTDDWNPGKSAWWISKIRSIRIEKITTPPPSPSSFPVIYAQSNYQGPAMAVERDWAGNRDWDGRPHRIRSIRVPEGWRLTLYENTNFRGAETRITSNITWGTGDHWNGRVRSIKVEKINPQPPTEPKGFPVLYAGTNFDGAAEAIERNKSEINAWDGSPHTIRSIRVPPGWYLVLYTKSGFRGNSYNLNSNITFAPGDAWYNKIRSIKVYKGTPPKQPR